MVHGLSVEMLSKGLHDLYAMTQYSIHYSVIAIIIQWNEERSVTRLLILFLRSLCPDPIQYSSGLYAMTQEYSFHYSVIAIIVVQW